MSKELAKLNKVPFSTKNELIQKIAYCDLVYSWLLLHSRFNEGQGYNYIYKNSYSVTKIAKACRKTRQTVYNHIEKLEKNNMLIDRGEYYIIPHSNPFSYFHGKTIFGLITLPMEDKSVQNVIATYVYLYKEYQNEVNHTSNTTYYTSIKEIMSRLGFSTGNQSTYDHFRFIFTILSGAGLIDYEWEKCSDNNLDISKIKIIDVKWKADDRWLKTIRDF